MSRLAKKPIAPGEATITFHDGVLHVKGSKGTLTKPVHPSVAITVTPEGAVITPQNRSRLARVLTGTFASHLRNMVAGVETPYMKKLVLEGVGYRVELRGKELVFTIGFSHPVAIAIPEDVTVTVEKNTMTLTSINKESLGQFAANVRRLKPPEPYKGKGIRYQGEVIRMKETKKSV